MAAWTDEQRANAQVIYNVGMSLGASVRDVQIAIMAAIVESGLRNLDYGDRDSIGLFQQRDAWGSREQRLDPASAARMFFLGGNAGQEGLLDIENRNSMSMGEAAQDVQVSAYPERYAQHQGEAGELIKMLDPNAQVPTGNPGTLGAVASPSPVSPSGQQADGTDSGYTEVDAAGAVTADESGIGALTFGDEDGQGPLDALTFGMPVLSADPASPQSPAGGGGQQTGGGDSGSVYMPTLEELGVYQGTDGSYTTTAPTGGRTFFGEIEGHEPHETTTIDGEVVDYLTAAALSAASEEFGGEFSLMQGGHSDYAASGGTHHGLGVVDLNVPDGRWEEAMIALRKKGFAAWIRNVPGYATAGSGAHIHAVLIDNPNLSPEAQTQVQSYLNNDNGLAGSAPDDGPRDFVNNRFSWGDAIKAAQQEDPQDNLQRQGIVKQAQQLLGTPFKWGGEDYRGLDDVGLVRKVYRGLGVHVPRLAFNLAYSADPEPVESAKIGDLIAWDNGERLGIYAGDGMYITAGGPGSAVQLNYLADLPDPWSIPVPKVARRQAYGPGGTGGPYTPPPAPTPAAPAYNYDAPASQAPTPGGGGSGGGGGSSSQQSPGGGGGTNNGDGNWHPTPSDY